MGAVGLMFRVFPMSSTTIFPLKPKPMFTVSEEQLVQVKKVLRFLFVTKLKETLYRVFKNLLNLNFRLNLSEANQKLQ